jgi:hypothetical protein
VPHGVQRTYEVLARRQSDCIAAPPAWLCSVAPSARDALGLYSHRVSGVGAAVAPRAHAAQPRSRPSRSSVAYPRGPHTYIVSQTLSTSWPAPSGAPLTFLASATGRHRHGTCRICTMRISIARYGQLCNSQIWRAVFDACPAACGGDDSSTPDAHASHVVPSLVTLSCVSPYTAPLPRRTSRFRRSPSSHLSVPVLAKYAAV